jgi:hypothetical protein
MRVQLRETIGISHDMEARALNCAHGKLHPCVGSKWPFRNGARETNDRAIGR